MTNRIIVSCLFIICSILGFGQEVKPLVVGDIVKIQSYHLHEERQLNIVLPEGYHPDSSKTYPVVYLLDGSLTEDLRHIAGLFQFTSYPWIGYTDEVIVVGIENVDRKRDFTHETTIEQDKKDFPTTGGSALFISFIHYEVLPYIETHYHVTNDKILIGQSLGGLLATEILVMHPQMFTHYFIISPSLWWDNGRVLEIEDTEMFKDNTLKTRVHIAVGKEGKIMEKGAKNLYKKLHRPKTNKDRITFSFMKDDDHASIMHAAIYEGIKKMFAKK